MWYYVRMNEAEVVKLANTADLKSADRKDLAGSSPALGIYATVAQLAVQHICNVQVAGSSPVSGFRRAAYSSVAQW